MKKTILFFLIFSILSENNACCKKLTVFSLVGIAKAGIEYLDWGTRYKIMRPIVKEIPFIGPFITKFVLSHPGKDFKPYRDEHDEHPHTLINFFAQDLKSTIFSPIAWCFNGINHIPCSFFNFLVDYIGARLQKKYTQRMGDSVTRRETKINEALKHLILCSWCSYS